MHPGPAQSPPAVSPPLRETLPPTAMSPALSPTPSRRRCLQALGAGLFLGPAWAETHGALGPVTPRLTPPDLHLTLHDGRQGRLRALLEGRLTALQLMFTTCSSTCPIQGAVFAALQARLTGPLAGVQLLSISINPLVDDAAALARWRLQLGAGAQWTAAAPPVRQADTLPDFMAGRRSGPGARDDPHTAQTCLFDRQGRLAYRFAELAGPSDLHQGLLALHRAA